MKKFLLAGVAAAGLAFTATTAEAALSLSGGVAGTIPGSEVSNAALRPVINGGLGFSNPLGGYYGAQVNVLAAGSVTIEFLGFEAGANNSFTFTGAGGGSHSTAAFRALPGNSAVQDIFSPAGIMPAFARNVDAGLLGFSFTTDFGGGSSVVNGANPVEPAPPEFAINFFATFQGPPGNAQPGATTGTTLYLFLDDTGSRRRNPAGSGFVPDDDNHDDMVIKITWSETPVPEPASLALLGAGLLGLGVAARRRRKA